MKDQTRVVKCALPLYLSGQNGKAVLIVHGYTGYAGEYYELANALHREGYTVSLPRLPGHGTNRKDFLQNGWRDWLKHVQNAYLDLQANYDSVYIAGLSMGGVLALILSSKFEPEKIVLMAPAIAVRGNISNTPWLRFFVKTKPKEWIPGKEDNDEVRFLGREYWSVHFTKQLANLYKLIKIAKKGLLGVQCPTLLILSEIDGSVPMEAGDIIENGLKNSTVKRITLKQSPHVILSGPEKDFIISEIINWFRKGE